MKIRLISFLFFLCLMTSLVPKNTLGQDADQKFEFQRRNIGLFFDKLREGKTVSIAYLGGSITQGQGASDPNKTSFRPLVTNWIRNRYPKAHINEINASASQTGSAFGAIRVRRDVVEQKPDLVFIEFATNDLEDKEDNVKRSIEGIIRQLLAVSEPPEIVLIYTTNAQRNSVVDWHESIASYYRIPSVNIQKSIWSQIDSGKFSFSSISKDGIHPNDDGYKLYADSIIEFLTAQEAARPSPPIRILPGYYLSDEMTYGELKPFAEITHSNTWHLEPTSDKTLPAMLLAGDKSNAEISMVFEGTVVGLTFRAGPDAGMIECLIDGKIAPAPLALIDTYSKEPHIGTRIIAGGLPPGEHKLTIRIKPDRNPKSTGNIIRLGAFLIGGARPERL